MNNIDLHKLGIDIGSTTVKIAILNEENELLFSDYERHFANIRETLSNLLQKAFDKLGNRKIAPMITGSCRTMRRRPTSPSSLAARTQKLFILKAET